MAPASVEEINCAHPSSEEKVIINKIMTTFGSETPDAARAGRAEEELEFRRETLFLLLSSTQLLPCHSLPTSQVKASCRVLKVGKSRREKSFRLCPNTSVRFPPPTKADLAT